MKLYVPVFPVLSTFLCLSLANTRMDPRITHTSVQGERSSLPKEEPNAVFYLSENDTLYIGGEEMLYHYDFETMKNYSIEADGKNCNGKLYCKNYITFVGLLLGKPTICGTNAYQPGCWAMDGKTFTKLPESWAYQLAPRTPVSSYTTLITGDQMFSTLPRRSNNGVIGKKTIFSKIYGNEPLLYTGDEFLRQPEFVKSLVVEKEDKLQNKILLFFTEDNTETRTIENRLSMVAQICKDDQGSAKNSIRYVFSTALKSRLICGNQVTGQYYPHLQDIYFLQGKTENVIYGLFKNSWNHSAVCSYKVQDIELLFNTSSLLGSSKNELKSHPGTCLPPPTLTPQETSEEVSNHPELTKWLWPSRNRTVFQNVVLYKKIVVDEIVAVNQKILILGTDDGTIHKSLQWEDEPYPIIEVQPFKQKGKLQFMELKQHVLYVGTTHEISRLSLDNCTVYNNCTDCVQSMDPFCGWIEGKCESVLKRNSSLGQQNVNDTCESQNESSKEYQKEDKNPHKVFTCLTVTVSILPSYNVKDGNLEIFQKCNNDTCNLIIKNVTNPTEYKCTAIEMEPQHAEVKNRLNTATKIQCIWLLVLTIQLVIIM
ncbi:semaphorin-7A isoform 1-T1 [Anomaloglossus baeobatrachus]|uniref:semaphorin-7A n=1 Tax=Anomaloglossus baeobatrachus TaxID=238106 RepID=UPI003F5047B4